MSKHAVIIGGGVIGLCAAHYAVQRGWKITVVERGDEQRDGCSWHNAGLVVPSHFVPLAAPGMVALGIKWMMNSTSPFHIKPRLSGALVDWVWKFWRAANAQHVRRAAPLLSDLNLASRDCFWEMAEATGNDFGLVEKGLLMLCKTQQVLNEESRIADKALELGMPAEVLNAAQTAALDPNVRMDIAGSVFFPKDCHMAPDRFLANLQDRLIKAGVQFAWNAEVTGWKVEGGKRIRAAELSGDRQIEADEFILCAGAWSPALARTLDLRLPMQAGKGYSLTLPSPRQSPEIAAILTEARVAVTPLGGALRFGGTMEIAGMNEDITLNRVRGIIEAVARYYPDFKPEDFARIKPWCGLRPCSPDGLPYLGRSARCRNLVVATGHAMMGLSLGPITGQLVAQIISGESHAFDLSQVSPDRYN